MRKSILGTFSFLVVASSSCGNENYDITQPIDTKMNVGGQIEMPLPGKTVEYTYKLRDFLSSGASSSLVQKPDGSLMLAIETSEELNETYRFGEIQADDFKKTDTYRFTAFQSVIGKEFDYPVNLPISLNVSGIDEQVEKIREVHLDARLRLTLQAPSEIGFTLLPGYTFTLPEFMYVDGSTLPEFAEIVQDEQGHSNVIRINTKQSVSPSFSLECHVNKLDVSSFGISTGCMKISGDAKARGKIVFDKVELADGAVFSVATTINITDVRPISVTLKSSPKISYDSQVIKIGKLPEALTDGSLEFSLSDVGFHVIVNNGTPFDFIVTSDISSYTGTSLNSDVSITANNGFIVPANSEDVGYCLSESGTYGDDDERKIAIKGLSGLISPIPDKIEISNTKISGSADGDGFVEVYTDGTYDVGLSYRIEAPLIFKALKLRHDEIIDLNVDLVEGYGFDDIFINAVVTSTLPLNAGLSCVLTDADGNAVDGVKLTSVDEAGNEIPSLEIPAGSLSAPSVKSLRLVAVAAEGQHINKLAGLKIHMEAELPEGKVAELNAEQSLSLSDIIVGTKSGVFIDVDADGDDEKMDNNR